MSRMRKMMIMALGYYAGQVRFRPWIYVESADGQQKFYTQSPEDAQTAVAILEESGVPAIVRSGSDILYTTTTEKS